MDLGDRITPCGPSRRAAEHLHVVTRHDSIEVSRTNDIAKASVGVEQVPAIALMIPGWPHSFEIGIRGDCIPGDDMGTGRCGDFDPLGTERVGICGEMQFDAGTHFVCAIDEHHAAVGNCPVEAVDIIQVQR